MRDYKAIYNEWLSNPYYDEETRKELAAIQGGLKTLGFSDHAAYEDPYPPERMDISEVLRMVVSNGMILYALTRKTEVRR